MTLRPEIQAYLKMRADQGFPAVWSVPIEEFRNLSLPTLEIQGVAEKVHAIEDRFIVGHTAYLPVRIYRPSQKSDLPAMVFFHGGGWVGGTVDAYDQPLTALANQLESVVIAVTYQKAPERPFPIPFDDCYSTLEWVVKNARSLGIDGARIGVAGDSAGGNLAAAVALKARDTKLVKLAYQLLIYPATTYSTDFDSVKRNATGYGLTPESMEWYGKQYVQNPEDMKNPYAWPALAHTHENLAPAIVMTAYYDVLQGDGIAYANTLRSAGVAVEHLDYPDVIHGVFHHAGYTQAAVEIQRDLANAVKKYI